jgi:hypothetical protein
VIACLALIQITGLYVEMLGMAAFRALEAAWPAFFEQVLPALLFRTEIPLKFHKRHPYHLRINYKAYELIV